MYTPQSAGSWKKLCEEIKEREEKIVWTQETMDKWLKVQVQWLCIELIISSEDILQWMPEEGRLFSLVDRSWKDIMRCAVKDPHVMAATNMPGLLDLLKDAKINKGLNAYLEKKQAKFSRQVKPEELSRSGCYRFFFMLNDEILEILSETKDPTRVQPHLKKCFEGIGRLDFDHRLDIPAMFSSEVEKAQLSQVI